MLVLEVGGCFVLVRTVELLLGTLNTAATRIRAIPFVVVVIVIVVFVTCQPLFGALKRSFAFGSLLIITITVTVLIVATGLSNVGPFAFRTPAVTPAPCGG